ncbi:MAG: hypothetical protein AAF927_14905 [Bacteroidota bacterium]
MTLLTKTKKCKRTSSTEAIFATKPYGYLTLPDPTKPNDFEVRVMVLLEHTYGSSPTITQSSAAGNHYVDIDLGTQTGTSANTFITEEIDVTQATGEDRVVIRLFDNDGRGTSQVGEVTLFFADADTETLSDFGPSAYIVNISDDEYNTEVSALIPLEGYVISNTDEIYNEDTRTFEITIDVAVGSGTDPLEYSVPLNMDENDSAEITVKKGGGVKGKVEVNKQYADDE